MKISTAQEAINGNSNDTVITPLRLKQVLNSKNISGGGSGGVTKETDPVFKSSPAGSITTSDVAKWNAKQEALVSGQNIKRVNGKSILGSGDIFFNTILSVNKPVNGEDIWFQRNVNLFKIMPTKIGYYIKQDGSLGYKAEARYFINDYMEVKANTSYSLSEKIYASGYHAWYDSDKNLISTFNQPNNYAITVTSPSNAAYVRFSLYDDPSGAGSDKLTFTFEETNPTSSDNCIYINDGSGNYIEFFNSSSVPTKTSQLINDSNFINQIKTINGQSIIGEGDIVIEGGSGSIVEVSVGPDEPTNNEKVWFQKSVNLFNKETAEQIGYIQQDGSIYKRSNYYITDYIKVIPGEQYTYSGFLVTVTNIGVINHAYYDENKNLVSTFARTKDFSGTITIPEGVSYVKFSLYFFSKDVENELYTFQFEKGSTVSEYQSYADGEKIYTKTKNGYEEFEVGYSGGGTGYIEIERLI